MEACVAKEELWWGQWSERSWDGRGKPNHAGPFKSWWRLVFILSEMCRCWKVLSRKITESGFCFNWITPAVVWIQVDPLRVWVYDDSQLFPSFPKPGLYIPTLLAFDKHCHPVGISLCNPLTLLCHPSTQSSSLDCVTGFGSMECVQTWLTKILKSEFTVYIGALVLLFAVRIADSVWILEWRYMKKPQPVANF